MVTAKKLFEVVGKNHKEGIMVRLLECQKGEVTDNKEDLVAFSIAMLCYLLDIYESDLMADELREIGDFCGDWCKR